MARKSEEEDAVVQQELESFSKAMETGDPGGVVGVINRLIERFGSQIVERLLTRLAAAEARVHAVEEALAKTRNLLDSLLAAPRRIERLLAVVPEDHDGEEVLWGLVAGPPVMACRFHKDVDPEAIGDPDERVFVWLVQSADGLVIRGRIDVPPLVDSGLEREFVFQGVVEEGDETNEEAQ
ncbi:MAG: hypothetical protein QUV05_21685 [Phycisphaerae bacterium]|nr:hypothetical protein [Phycisphaerae bacterium]